jgi:hypothetical protein
MYFNWHAINFWLYQQWKEYRMAECKKAKKFFLYKFIGIFDGPYRSLPLNCSSGSLFMYVIVMPQYS